MRQKIFLLNAFVFIVTMIFAQNNYDVKLIPAALIENADVVKRNEELFVEINDIGKATITTKYAYTILNAAGDDKANFVEGYSKLISLKNIDGTLYDANGKKIRALKNSEVSDLSGTDGGTIADDSRLKTHNFNHSVYPYTIEYEFTQKLNGILSLPKWQPIDDENIAVEKSSFKVLTPLDYNLRYKSFNYKSDPSISTEKNTKVYQWQMQNLNAIKGEMFQPVFYEITTAVFIAPTNFEIQDYKGTMNDWNGFGKFIYSLNNGRDVLPDVLKQKIHTIADGLKNDNEKVKAIYNYLQSNTRYVSIQLGIGGWQTFEAKYVADKGYGDCKALSNYMVAMLKETGIKAYYTLIRAGENSTYFLDDFPSNQFNHIIVCVPNKGDTTWLECTSQNIAAGYLGDFTCDRSALLIDENGGKLVRTTVYDKNQNLQSRKITATINEDGNLTAIINTKFVGLQQDDVQGMLNALSKNKIEEYLNESINLPTYDIVKFDYKEEKSNLPTVTENLEIKANSYATINGKRLFLSPNMFNKTGTKLKDAAKRKFDIILPIGYTDIDSVEFTIPNGYVIESLPTDKTIESKFGKYTATVKVTGNKIYYIRFNQRIKGRHLATDAFKLSEYFKEVYDADRARVVLVKE